MLWLQQRLSHSSFSFNNIPLLFIASSVFFNDWYFKRLFCGNNYNTQHFQADTNQFAPLNSPFLTRQRGEIKRGPRVEKVFEWYPVAINVDNHSFHGTNIPCAPIQFLPRHHVHALRFVINWVWRLWDSVLLIQIWRLKSWGIITLGNLKLHALHMRHKILSKLWRLWESLKQHFKYFGKYKTTFTPINVHLNF